MTLDLTDPNFDSFKLNDGTNSTPAYSGPDDQRLAELVKDLWLRRLYGGRVDRAVRDHRRHRETYGPGWGEGSTSEGGANALKNAAKSALDFLEGIRWYRQVDRFLYLCQQISRYADPCEGVVFLDPLDGVRVQWNPPERATIYVSLGDQKLTVLAPGRRGVLAVANQDGDYPVSDGKLSRMIAPCLTHMIDAFYSSLVIERLAARSIRDFVAVHDCWLVPTDIDTLSDVLNDAAEEWLRGLGPVYERLLYYLKDTQFEDEIREMQSKWAARVQGKQWPKFRAADANPFAIIDRNDPATPSSNPAIS